MMSILMRCLLSAQRYDYPRVYGLNENDKMTHESIIKLPLWHYLGSGTGIESILSANNNKIK